MLRDFSELECCWMCIYTTDVTCELCIITVKRYIWVSDPAWLKWWENVISCGIMWMWTKNKWMVLRIVLSINELTYTHTHEKMEKNRGRGRCGTICSCINTNIFKLLSYLYDFITSDTAIMRDACKKRTDTLVDGASSIICSVIIIAVKYYSI